jgi:hypothetical protein
VITTILAIYGAVVSTVSVLLSVWFFRAAGPRLQAQAFFEFHFLAEGEEDSGDRTLTVKVWNTGRHPIKVDLERILTIKHGSGGETGIPMDWHGPDLPIWIPGHSGEEWRNEVPDLPGSLKARLWAASRRGRLSRTECSLNLWRLVTTSMKSRCRYPTGEPLLIQ